MTEIECQPGSSKMPAMPPPEIPSEKLIGDKNDKSKSSFAKPAFKSRKRKGNLRKITTLNAEVEDLTEPDYSGVEYKQHGVSSIEKAKILAKRRCRGNGLVSKLIENESDKYKDDKDYTEKNTWKEKGGLMSSDRAMMFLDDDESAINLRHLNSTFAKESKRTDHEQAMKEFIDKEVAKRKGYLEEYEKRQEDHNVATLKALEDRKLYKMEDKYENIPRTYNPKHLGDMGHNILEGIPEIQLGTENRIENIEKTMQTVQKLHEIDQELRDKVTHVPSNYTANYLLHNKYMGEIFERSDTNRYMDVKEDLGAYNQPKYDVCNDGMTR